MLDLTSKFNVPKLSVAGVCAGSLCLSIIFAHLNLLTIIFFVFLTSLLFFKFANNTKIVIYCSVFFALGVYRYSSIKTDYIALQKELYGKNINIIGKICDIAKKNNCIGYRIILEIIDAKLEEESCEKLKNHNICIYCKLKPELKLADIIEIKNIKISKNKTEDIDNFFIKENIILTYFLPKLNYKKLENQNNIGSICLEKKQQIHKNLKLKMNEDAFSLFNSIFLGFKQENKFYGKIKGFFSNWGITHYLARSGLHVILLIWVLNLLLQLIPAHIFYKRIILLLFIIFYTLLSWPAISFYRAIFMFFLYQLGMLLFLNVNSLQTLFLTTILTLLYNPFYILFLDFQLSFALTLGLIIFPKINKFS